MTTRLRQKLADMYAALDRSTYTDADRYDWIIEHLKETERQWLMREYAASVPTTKMNCGDCTYAENREGMKFDFLTRMLTLRIIFQQTRPLEPVDVSV